MEILQKKRIILASASPRRRDILKDMGLDFEVVVGDADESLVSARTTSGLVKRLSFTKVMACIASHNAQDNNADTGADTADITAGCTTKNGEKDAACIGSLGDKSNLQNKGFICEKCNNKALFMQKYGNIAVIGADTVVVRRNKIYGKPYTRDKAIEMISELNGKWHSVYTGVTVLTYGSIKTFCVRSRVKFKSLDEEEIEKYVDECKPFDKAGAYGIQDKRIVEKYKGSYTNIVGLPKEKLANVLKRVGVIDECN